MEIARKAAIGVLSLLVFVSWLGCVVSVSFFVRALFPFSLSGVLNGLIWGAISYGSLRLWAWPLRKLGIELTAQGPRRVP